MKYRLYIDEVGNADLGSSDDPNHRFLSLTGIAVALDHVEEVIHPELEALKRAYFGSHPDDPIIFHRKEMLNALPPFAALADGATRARFDAELLGLLSRWEYTVIGVCIDKKKHRETYTTWRFDPYHDCLQVLLERFVFFLDSKGAAGDVMAESRGGKEDRRLKASFENLWAKGTQFLDHGRFQKRLTSRQPKSRPRRTTSRVCNWPTSSHTPAARKYSTRTNWWTNCPPRSRPRSSPYSPASITESGGERSERKCSSAKKKALAGPMAFAIHLRLTGLPSLSTDSGGCQEGANARMIGVGTAAESGGESDALRTDVECAMSAAPRFPTELGYAGLKMNAEEYLALGETPERYELINGVVCESPSIPCEHSEIVAEVAYQIKTFADGGGDARFSMNTDVKFSDTHVYRPDIAAYRAAKLRGSKRRLPSPPDLIVEVLSRGSKALDLITKRADYERFGVAEYWVVDPETLGVRCWRRVDGAFAEMAAETNKIACAALPGFELDTDRLRGLFESDDA